MTAMCSSRLYCAKKNIFSEVSRILSNWGFTVLTHCLVRSYCRLILPYPFRNSGQMMTRITMTMITITTITLVPNLWGSAALIYKSSVACCPEQFLSTSLTLKLHPISTVTSFSHLLLSLLNGVPQKVSGSKFCTHSCFFRRFLGTFTVHRNLLNLTVVTINVRKSLSYLICNILHCSFFFVLNSKYLCKQILAIYVLPSK
jgi:hypothetical protein